MKKTSKAIIFILTAALICTALCGCAAKAPETVEVSAPPAEEATPVEYRYAADIRVLSGDGPYLAARACGDEEFYSVDYGVWDEAQGDYVTAVFCVNYDGEVERLESYVPVQPPEEYLTLPEFYSTHELEGLALDKDGNLVTVESLYMSWYAGPGQRRDEYASMYDAYEYASYVRLLDKNGAELSCARLPQAADENIYAYEMKLDGQGNLVVSSENSLRFYSAEGVEKGRLELPGYIRGILQSADGDIAAVCYQGGGDELLCRISPEMSIESRHTIPGGMMCLSLGEKENELFYSNGQNFYSLDLNSGESRLLFNWLACGVDMGSLSHVQMLPEGNVRAIGSAANADGGYTTELVEIAFRPVYAGEEKAELTLGCLEADNELINALKDFNRESQTSSIRLIEYRMEHDFTENGQEQALRSRLLSDVPDILILDGLNHRLLASKGLLADMNPWLEADALLSREDFFENVLLSCERDGRLYALADSFSVDTVMANAEISGDEPGWSYEQYNAALASMPVGCQPFERHVSSEDILRSLLAMELDSYVDYGSLTADFANDSFIGVLNFSRNFPEYFDWDSYEWTDADITEYRVNGGRQMLMRTTLLSAEEIYFNSIYFGGNGAYIGYPTYDGSVGSALMLHRLCAIGDNSAHKDEAWRFISALISGEKQSGSWGFSTLKDRCLEKTAQFSVPEYLVGEDEQPVLTEDGEQIELAQGHMGTVLGVRGFYALDDIKRLRFERALETASKLKCEDTELTELIVETVRPFLQGQTDAASAAAQVETQVNVWLSKFK